jgi:hypothetical protein
MMKLQQFTMILHKLQNITFKKSVILTYSNIHYETLSNEAQQPLFAFLYLAC